LIGYVRRHVVALALAGALVLAGAAGYLASAALSAGSGPPTTTTTVNVAVGATGPAGPAGPTGPAGDPGPPGTGGAEQCPTGSTFQAVVINHPGGQITLWVCVTK